MLVLSRKRNEEIVFPELDIRLTIVSLGQGRVKVGIDAPRDIRVSRQEIYDDSLRPAGAVQQELTAAAP